MAAAVRAIDLPGSARKFPKPLRDVMLVAWLYLLPYRQGALINSITTLLAPFSMLFFTRFLAPAGINPGPRIVVGTMVYGLGIATVQQVSRTILWERFSNQIKLIVVQPVHRLSYAAGILSFAMFRGALVAVAMLILAPVFGIDVHLSFWLLPIGVLTALSLSGVALVIGTRSPSDETGRLLANGAGVLVAMFSPVYYDISRLPEALQWPARLSPYTHAASAMNQVASGQGVPYSEIGVLAVLTLVLVSLGINGMRWRES